MEKKKKRSWDQKNLQIAMDKVLCKEMSLREPSLRYDIPRSTLHDKTSLLNLGKEVSLTPKIGRFTKTFSPEYEETLVEHVTNLSNRCLPLMKKEFLKLAFDLAETLKIPHRFNKDKGIAVAIRGDAIRFLSAIAVLGQVRDRAFKASRLCVAIGGRIAIKLVAVTLTRHPLFVWGLYDYWECPHALDNFLKLSLVPSFGSFRSVHLFKQPLMALDDAWTRNSTIQEPREATLITSLTNERKRPLAALTDARDGRKSIYPLRWLAGSRQRYISVLNETRALDCRRLATAPAIGHPTSGVNLVYGHRRCLARTRAACTASFAPTPCFPTITAKDTRCRPLARSRARP
ncbi:hypothetical protein EVAR_54128_1 [Eumeta japonica]|uniref:HTH psq-type domain-containing protein n=1 Tax=Eumeta variegata TaxID=151549 RepID=A0A4C1Z2Y7_EUMVA|nr:hypothetical protein EVAR_54128_1 [Eumeta japonica]